MAANDLDAIIAPTNGPAWVTDPVNGDSFDGFVVVVEPVGDHRLRQHHGAGGLRRPAAGRRVVHRRPLGRADADRPRLRLRAGDPRPRPAAVPASTSAAKAKASERAHGKQRSLIPGRGKAPGAALR